MTKTLELTLSDLLRKVQEGQIPLTATVTVTFDESAVRSPDNDISSNPTLDLLRQWTEQDASLSPSERDSEEELWDKFEKNINESRANAGMRTL
ncbi:MAG: hypothetical protein OHK0029_33650 [Armatimonadaceae bacterium]